MKNNPQILGGQSSDTVTTSTEHKNTACGAESDYRNCLTTVSLPWRSKEVEITVEQLMLSAWLDCLPLHFFKYYPKDINQVLGAFQETRQVTTWLWHSKSASIQVPLAPQQCNWYLQITMHLKLCFSYAHIK